MHRAVIVAVLALAALVVTATQPANAAAAPTRYVALGDSYSAASGVLPPDPSAPPQCLRSIRNYPHVIANTLGAQLTDVTCGAADTNDFFTAQYSDVPPQLDAVRADTQLVTMTIGGNDSNVFINTITSCGTAAATTLGQGSPCKDRYGSSFEDTIRTTTYPSLVRALRAVRAKAPRAKVAILGYPWIMPRTGGCFTMMPVAEGDVAYVRGIQATLNDAIRRAAAATGAIHVDMNTVSEGHDACKPIGVRWIEPVLQGTNPVVVHPNALGESQMAAHAVRVIRASPAPATPRARTRFSRVSVTARQPRGRSAVVARVSGRLSGAAAGCSGRVTVLLRVRGNTVARRLPALSRRCTFVSTASFSTRSLPASLRSRRHSLRIGIALRYAGNRALRPALQSRTAPVARW